MNQADLFRIAAHIERDLRTKGVPPTMIPGVLGAAFMASLTNLDPWERACALNAHLVALEGVRNAVMEAMKAP